MHRLILAALTSRTASTPNKPVVRPTFRARTDSPPNSTVNRDSCSTNNYSRAIGPTLALKCLHRRCRRLLLLETTTWSPFHRLSSFTLLDKRRNTTPHRSNKNRYRLLLRLRRQRRQRLNDESSVVQDEKMAITLSLPVCRASMFAPRVCLRRGV